MVRRRSGVRFPSPAPLRILAKPGRKTKSPCAITPTTMSELRKVFMIGHQASATHCGTRLRDLFVWPQTFYPAEWL